MTREQALLEAVAAAQAREALAISVEEAEALRSRAGHDAAAAVEKAVLRPDDREAARAARRALGALARAHGAYLELRALHRHNAREVEVLAREYRIRLEEVEALREHRRNVARERDRLALVEA